MEKADIYTGAQTKPSTLCW